jgi:selenocysteine lyase/cysteine desulfurase
LDSRGDEGRFLARFPEYAATAAVDRLREEEYAYLGDHVYLDYTGAGLAAVAQYEAHAARLRSASFGNPHSENPTSARSTELVEQARAAVLRFLNAPPDEYVAIFTANATGACRLVGEAYPFGDGRELLLTVDNHNSVNGIREYARGRGARTRYVPLSVPELRIDQAALVAALAAGGGGLFAFPAQSNFTGVRHGLDAIEVAHAAGYDVLVDAAAYLPTNRLDLASVKADFVAVSWYKVFGYPTGVGCLVARRAALGRLRRPWFAGGTIRAVSVQADWHVLMDDETAYEDGTLNYLSIPDVTVGLGWVDEVGVDVITTRVRCLTGWLLDGLARLRHTNGAPLVRIFGPADTRDRGGTVAFNLLDPAGALVDERLVAAESAAAGFSLRTGCFCNPGAGERGFGVSAAALAQAPGFGFRTLDDYLDALGLPTGGAVRVSFGIASTFGDVDRFLGFVADAYLDRPATAAGLAPRIRC